MKNETGLNFMGASLRVRGSASYSWVMHPGIAPHTGAPVGGEFLVSFSSTI